MKKKKKSCKFGNEEFYTKYNMIILFVSIISVFQLLWFDWY